MTLDSTLIGTLRPGASLLVGRSRLRLFAKATGQRDPVFTDVEAAREAGHPDLPIPPTFPFSIDLEGPDPVAAIESFGIDIRAVLHGIQEFDYHKVAYAGDTLTSTSVVTDVYEKKGGALQFLVTTTTIKDQNDEAVATMRNTLVIRELTGMTP